MNPYPVGSLVQTRDRDWVVLPTDDPEVVRLRPLAGSEYESCSIFLPLEPDALSPAEFPLPDPRRSGDFVVGRLLRDAARLSLRSSATPFQSLSRVSVRPRPYQFVPLIMALRSDPVRLLIADDVGVGKTIEAGLIARELLDRGEIQRLCVLCPPYLCEQWQRELVEKFHLDARIVRTGTLTRLERELPRGDLSIYDYYRCLVISTDFIKGERRRYEFLARCPELVIVDEAHTCARPRGDRDRAQQQRHDLVSRVAADTGRHLLLLTATPHSGIEESFRSLLGLLKPDFEGLGFHALRDRDRRRLARYFVQRRRADVEKWLGEPTPFPERVSEEATYRLTPEYQSLFSDILKFARERVQEPGMPYHRQRVRYWAAVSLLRCLMSSPASAVQALSRRERSLREAEEGEVNEEQRRREVMDPVAEEGVLDVVPDVAADLPESGWWRLQNFRQRAEKIEKSGDDPKLSRAAKVTDELLSEGFHPIVYCRFIPTAHYVAEGLKKRLSKHRDLQVVAVTGEMDDEHREERVRDLARFEKRVLVATDCLSEGINLQEYFDAVMHYDLPWNPNRLEQREGRVDRYGQRRSQVRAVLVYGTDNPVDGAVLDVLLKKARTIRHSLGISVPGYTGPPFRWDEERRAALRAELDAYYALLYGLTREELHYILDPQEVMGENFPGETFRVLKDNEERRYGEYRTKRLVLEAYDRLAASNAVLLKRA